MKAQQTSHSIVPIAMPGTHERFLPFFQEKITQEKPIILDIGAGHGAFSKRLFELGYEVHACDLFPELFHFEEIECKRADLGAPLPYPEETFDYLIAIEVMEHIHDHAIFFREAQRILKPGGSLFISTPNILSLKSRIKFLLSGFYYSFGPLDHQNYDGLQHVASLTADQYEYVATRHGLIPTSLEVDRVQKSSRAWLFLYPFLWLYTKVKRIKPKHNLLKLLTGRLLFMEFRK